MQEIGLDNIQIYGINTFEVPAVLEEVSDFAEGAVYPIPADKNPPKSVEKYSKEFKDKYGRENGVYSANGYDTFSVLLGAINSCGHENQDCVIEELSSLRDYEGANGLLSVDENGIGIYDGIMLKTVKNGKFVPI
jgi:branched-chain amino acid transport system substrate-binding protein